jgi:hypothetical protein
MRRGRRASAQTALGAGRLSRGARDERVVTGKPHSPGAVSVEVDGRRDRFSLPRVARFPSTCGLMRALRRSGGDVFIENAGAAGGPSRVKILGVVSADCP